MTSHKWFDGNVKKVRLAGNEDKIKIILKDYTNTEYAITISKEDVIAMVKEFKLKN